MEILVVVWLACAVLCAVIARSKNRSGLGWFVVGLLTSVLGLIAAAGMAARPTAAEAAVTAAAAEAAGYHPSPSFTPADAAALLATIAIAYGVIWTINAFIAG